MNANQEANPELLRLALKLATVTGKTTVTAMLIARQTINAVRRPQSRKFSRGFLVVTPGLTIRVRLRRENGLTSSVFSATMNHLNEDFPALSPLEDRVLSTENRMTQNHVVIWEISDNRVVQNRSRRCRRTLFKLRFGGVK